mmetsp:Transcript_19946/g.60390  ORF Transcript_19946/g.60390 Transcript_19946/m.60390 type:complete len:207 (+) Transcript_19946:541-1161(+)
MEPATLGPAASTNSTASSVVMCSTTTVSVGLRATSGLSTSSTKVASRSKMSVSGVVTSPWMQSTSPTSAMASSAGCTSIRSVTPESEFVVAPAGYSLQATTLPLSLAVWISSGVVLSVKYSVIRGSKPSASGGTHARMRSRYSSAIAVVVTGGRRFGMARARRKPRATCATVLASTSPSRKWWWKSSQGGSDRTTSTAMSPKLYIV